MHRWDIGTFAAGSFTLDALVKTAHQVDFAILIATGEDTLVSRGKESKTVRDNIIFEFGLFLGTLGRERVYWLSTDDAKLPSDLQGLTRLIYKKRDDGNIQAGLTAAVLQAENAMKLVGISKPLREPEIAALSSVEAAVGKAMNDNLVIGEETQRDQPARQLIPDSVPHHGSPGYLEKVHKEQTGQALEEEIEWLCKNARDQGWSVAKNNQTMLRLISPKGVAFALRRKRPASTRVELRQFVSELKANGLRVNGALQLDVENSPFGS